MNGNEFGEWLDSRGISVAEASSYFGVSEKTIYQWRSTSGVPDRKTQWVAERMADYAAKLSNDAPERVSLEITREQFIAWNRAALIEGKIIYDWATDALDEAAAEAGDDSTGSSLPFNPLSSLKVAEPGEPYNPTKDKP
jgi:transposase